jgi:oxygen-independent coproporphyrinogen-3 oxidase
MPGHIEHLYVHIPFCPAKCDYCAFVTHVGSLKLVEPYLDALRREAELRHRKRWGGPLKTLYFGGGTPSMLAPEQLYGLVRHLNGLMRLSSSCEITVECHPATVSFPKLLGYRNAGVNRLSFGAESLDDGELVALGRTHREADVARAVDQARTAGFTDIALDLMYGIPQQTLESWRTTLERVVQMDVTHLSLYPLSIEPKTVFAKRKRRFGLDVPEDESVVAMYELACRMLRDAGYDHYEVANWAKPGHRCLHNVAYWRNAEFHGLGTGAHAYLHPYRTENNPHTGSYVKRVLAGLDPVTVSEQVDVHTRAEETMMLGLRLLRDGPDLGAVERDLGRHPLEQLKDEIGPLIDAGLITLTPDRLVLRETAVPVANEVWERLLLSRPARGSAFATPVM